MKTMIFFLTLISSIAFAIPEQNFSENWQNQVLPHFSTGTQRVFVNPLGMKLNYYSFLSSKNTKTLVILPGRTEPALKYAEMIYDLKNHGFNIYILDHQGQGASERILKDTHKGYVRKFSNYVQDFSNWMNEVVIPETNNQERFLVGHSMGGTIGALYLSKEASIFKKAILSAPMLEVNTAPYKETVARILSGALSLAGQATKYAPDRGPYIPENDTFIKNEVTHSEMRFNLAKEIFVKNPQLVLGGPTNRWVNQSLKATKKIDKLASEIKIPILLLQAGKDLIVKPTRQTDFCHKALDCKLIPMPEAYHEILQETDVIRDEAMKMILAFLFSA